MRENRTSGLMRGSNGNGDSRPLLSTLLVSNICVNPADPVSKGFQTPPNRKLALSVVERARFYLVVSSQFDFASVGITKNVGSFRKRHFFPLPFNCYGQGKEMGPPNNLCQLLSEGFTKAMTQSPFGFGQGRLCDWP